MSASLFGALVRGGARTQPPSLKQQCCSVYLPHHLSSGWSAGLADVGTQRSSGRSICKAGIEGLGAMSLLLIILVLVLLFGGGGYWGHSQGYYGRGGFGGIIGLLVIVLIVLFLFGGIGAGPHVAP
jgi:hypothetical protein